MNSHAKDGKPCYDSSETLRCLYAEYSERMRNRGAHIWIIGAVFIPLSFAGIVTGIDNPWQTAFIAVFSAGVIWAWVLISESMRVAYERHRAVCEILESAMLKQELSLDGKTLSDLLEPLHKERWPRLHIIRPGIAVVVTVMWVLVAVASFVIPPP
jgi:MFS family permease